MKLSQLSLAIVLSLSAAGAFAQAKAPEPDSTVSYNIAVTNDYRYRGISQTGLSPALQGGADYSHKNGLYLGVWASSINWIKDSNATAKGPVEIDLYGGYKGEFNKTVAYDVGLLQYWFAGNNLNPNANTTEAYAAATFGGIVTAKYSHALTNLFGANNSKGSGYLDLSANFDMGNGWSIVPHVGQQTIKNAAVSRYTDYSLTVNKDIDGLVLSAGLVSTDKKNTFMGGSTGGRDLGKDGLVLTVKKNF